jgi:putative membrane protein
MMQIRTLLRGAGCLVLFAVPAYTASLNKADQQFLIVAAKTDMTEAHKGEMAGSLADRQAVKDFARALVQDHTESYGHLADLAGKTGVSIPKGIDTGKDPTIQQLQHLKGASFDRAFERDEIASHKRTLEIFKREAAHAKDPDVKAYATS